MVDDIAPPLKVLRRRRCGGYISSTTSSNLPLVLKRLTLLCLCLHVVVMGYRNFAGDPAGDNGLIAVNEDHVNHAHNTHRNRKVLIGLRTTGIHSEGGHPVETFFGSSPMNLHTAKARVERFFATNNGFGGFATHRYDPSGLATSFPAPAVND